jgi:hypothetical protein
VACRLDPASGVPPPSMAVDAHSVTRRRASMRGLTLGRRQCAVRFRSRRPVPASTPGRWRSMHGLAAAGGRRTAARPRCRLPDAGGPGLGRAAGLTAAPAGIAGCPGILPGRDMRVRIGERVRAAHVSQYCPGGLGFAAASISSTGLDLDDATAAQLTAEDHLACAAGRACGRCGQPIEAAQQGRRRASGDWVHESCPLTPRSHLTAKGLPSEG